MKSFLYYALFVGIPILGVALILRAGAMLHPALAAGIAPPGSVTLPAFPAKPDVWRLLLQVGIVVIVSRGAGMIFRNIGQPRVVGEMVAGIFLGPSLLGWLLPNVSAFLFPPKSLGYLDALCQVGLVIFMFLVGAELDLALLKGRKKIALITSHASIVAPFLLGTALAIYVYPRFATARVPFASFALFLGAAMSVTAFPVLARILIERGEERQPFGAVALACAAVDDVSAWCILAAVVMVARAGTGATPPWKMLIGLAAFVGLMLGIARPAFRRFRTLYERRGTLSPDVLALVLVSVFTSALICEWIGIHALFGAFLAGTLMPRGGTFIRALTEKTRDFAVVLLLPLFFALTGLRTSLSLVSGGDAWLCTALILVLAIAGKFGGSSLAARLCGMPWREAASLGVLMNTRGLMELVILNVGLEIGVISPTVFSMMVLMAIVTTFMTSPLLQRISPSR